MALDIETLLIPFIVPAITAVVIFASQWHKKGSQIEISGVDITNMKKQMDTINENMNKIMDKINELNVNIEVFKYRIQSLESVNDNKNIDKYPQQPFRPRYNNEE